MHTSLLSGKGRPPPPPTPFQHPWCALVCLRLSVEATFLSSQIRFWDPYYTEANSSRCSFSTMVKWEAAPTEQGRLQNLSQRGTGIFKGTQKVKNMYLKVYNRYQFKQFPQNLVGPRPPPLPCNRPYIQKHYISIESGGGVCPFKWNTSY